MLNRLARDVTLIVAATLAVAGEATCQQGSRIPPRNVRGVVQAWVDAISNGDVRHAAKLMNWNGLAEDMHAAGRRLGLKHPRPGINAPAGLYDWFRETFGWYAPRTPKHWKRGVIVDLDLRSDRKVATAALVVILDDRSTLHLRLRLSKAHGTWRIRDWNRIYFGMWASEFAAPWYCQKSKRGTGKGNPLEKIHDLAKKAERAFGSGGHAKSSEFLTQARLLKPPRRVMAVLGMLEARLQLYAGKFADACVTCDRSLGLDRRLVFLHHVRGLAANRLRRDKETIRSLLRFEKEFGVDETASVVLGRANMRLNRKAAAIKELRRGLAVFPESPWIGPELGELLVAARRPVEAVEVYARALDHVEHAPALLGRAARVLGGAGAWQQVLTLCSSARSGPSALEHRDTRCLELLALRRMKNRDALKKALAGIPAGETCTWGVGLDVQLALSSAWLGDETAAMVQAARASEHSEYKTLTGLVRAVTRAAASEPRATLQNLRQAIAGDCRVAALIDGDPLLGPLASDPSLVDLLQRATDGRQRLLEAGRLVRRRRWKDLLAFSRKTLERLPHDAQTLEHVALALERLNRLPEAERHCRRVMKEESATAGVLAGRRLVYELVLQGRHGPALELAARLVREHADDASVHLARAWALSRAGTAESVLANLRAALDRNPDLAFDVRNDPSYEGIMAHEACAKLVRATLTGRPSRPGGQPPWLQ